MSRLKDRNRQIPGGMFHYTPETKFKTQDWSSFSSIVDQVIAHRRGNPAMVAKHKWSLDQATVENEVDAFVANVCLQMGWDNFVVGDGGGPPPKAHLTSQAELSKLSVAAAKVRNMWIGVRTLNEWVFSDSPAVQQEQANARAATCVKCPLNGKGDFSQWFVKPLVMIIEKQMARRTERQLSTIHDDKLGVCQACDCPMALKCHAPTSVVLNNISGETLDKLRSGNNCWILSEAKSA